MKPNEMEQAILRNLAAKTGRSLDEWFKVLRDTGLTDKRELKDQLKLVCGVGHFQAQPITKHHLLL
jgi:hypothetical protein